MFMLVLARFVEWVLSEPKWKSETFKLGTLSADKIQTGTIPVKTIPVGLLPGSVRLTNSNFIEYRAPSFGPVSQMDWSLDYIRSRYGDSSDERR